jgi:hypothetical protein
VLTAYLIVVARTSQPEITLRIPFKMVSLDSSYGPIESWVEVDGERVLEYGLSRSEGMTHTCYIPSKAGKVRI